MLIITLINTKLSNDMRYYDVSLHYEYRLLMKKSHILQFVSNRTEKSVDDFIHGN